MADATARSRGRSHLSSFTCETIGIMISGKIVKPSSVSRQAAVTMARTCIS